MPNFRNYHRIAFLMTQFVLQRRWEFPRTHLSVKPGSRLEVRLDTQRQNCWRGKQRRSVGMFCNHAGGRLYATRLFEARHYSD